MNHISLATIIEKLKSSPRVRGIFTAGSTASQLNSSSDIDLVIVLDKNREEIKSVYTMIENRFSDIFFFDADFIKKLNGKQKVSGNDFDGMFLEWLASGKVEYDPEKLLLPLKKKINKKPPLQKLADSEKRKYWIKTNYNFIANSRYYNSKNKLYHQALELRLLYSIIELIVAYFYFRDIPWRGEKCAVKYFEKNDRGFLVIFQAYYKSNNLKDKMKYYEKLFNEIFINKYQKWGNDFIVPISNKNQYNEKMINFWEKLVR